MCNWEGCPGDTLNQTITLVGTIPTERTGYWSVYYEHVEEDDEELMNITSWITVEPDKYTLNSGEIKTFTVTIKIPKNAEPGLYGATSGSACEVGHSDERRMYIQFQDTNIGGNEYSGLRIPISVNVLGKTIFHTGPGTYPSISGIHIGTITPNRDISVHTLYTYSCEGTGGHTEYVWIQGHGVNESASRDGYNDDYQTINFTNTFKLREGKKYNYTIKTGSYPQIVHEHSKNVTGGEITCTQFTDANGEIYDDWIPAIRFV
jgi:hypothetical protein